MRYIDVLAVTVGVGIVGSLAVLPRVWAKGGQMGPQPAAGQDLAGQITAAVKALNGTNPGPVSRVNLNSSKSNAFRAAGLTEQPVLRTSAINNSKSNTMRAGGGGDGIKLTALIASAVARNPVAWVIPCHRVLRGDGDLAGYAWGLDRKAAIVGWEATRGGRG